MIKTKAVRQKHVKAISAYPSMWQANCCEKQLWCRRI